jgi:hypothetical protein
MQEIKIDEDGNKRYLCNGQLHREDGPAVERVNGDKYWFLHGQLHREDGPAIEYAGGSKKFYLQDKHYLEEEYWRIVKLKALW